MSLYSQRAALRGETFCSPSLSFTADSAETALISPVSFQGFLSNWKYGIQAAHTHTYHASNNNSRSASPYPSQGQSASRRSSQQRTDESSLTEMDSASVSRRDSDMQMVTDGTSLPALHSSDSGSQRQRTQVSLPPLTLSRSHTVSLLFSCYLSLSLSHTHTHTHTHNLTHFPSLSVLSKRPFP